MGVCTRLEFDDSMLIYCLGYDFYIYGEFGFFMRFHCQFIYVMYDITTKPDGTLL